MANNNQMTPTQRNYAITRVNEILTEKERAVRKGCLRQEARNLTYDEAVKLIITGVIKPKKQKGTLTYDHYTHFGDVFDVEAATDYYRPNSTYDEKAFSKTMAAVRERALVIKDRLILGDASEALKMVNEFEAETNGNKKGR